MAWRPHHVLRVHPVWTTLSPGAHNVWWKPRGRDPPCTKATCPRSKLSTRTRTQDPLRAKGPTLFSKHVSEGPPCMLEAHSTQRPLA